MSLACSCMELERKAAALVKLALRVWCCVVQNRQEQKIAGHVVVLSEENPQLGKKPQN